MNFDHDLYETELERARLDLSIFRFDPRKHPRNLLGQFREVMHGMKPDDIVEFPTGWRIKKQRSDDRMFQSEYWIEGPNGERGRWARVVFDTWDDMDDIDLPREERVIKEIGGETFGLEPEIDEDDGTDILAPPGYRWEDGKLVETNIKEAAYKRIQEQIEAEYVAAGVQGVFEDIEMLFPEADPELRDYGVTWRDEYNSQWVVEPVGDRWAVTVERENGTTDTAKTDNLQDLFDEIREL